MSQVEWTTVEGAGATPDGSGLPYATHHGELMLGPYKIRCYRLNNGTAILNAEDVHRMLGFEEEQ